MRATRFLACLIVFTSFVFGLATAEEGSVQFTKVSFPEHRVGSLENGVQTFVMRWSSGNLASLELVFPAGSALDPKGREGLAYFASKLLSGNLELSKKLETLGASFDASVTRDGLYVELTCIAPSLQKALGLIGGLLNHPTFSTEDFQRQKQLQLGELAYNRANPSWVAQASFYEAYFREHPYAHSPLGTQEGIEAIAPEDVRSYYTEGLKASRGTVVTLVSPLPLSDQEKLLQNALAALQRTDEEKPFANPVQAPKAGVFIVPFPEANQAQIVMGHEGVAAGSPYRFRVLLMNSILGGNAFSSRLFEKARVQEGLTYSIRSSFDSYNNSGLFLVRTFTRTSETARMLSLVGTLVGQMGVEPPSNEELTDAKSSLVLGYPLKLQPVDSVADRFANCLFYGLPLTDILDYQDHLNALTKEDVLQAAKACLFPDRLLSVVVGQPEPLQQALEQHNPTLLPSK